jgi:anti-anti-sigma factor
MIKFSFFSENNKVDINLNGDLDIDSTEIIEEELIPLLNNYLRVRINFADVPFVDSSGMGLLVYLVQTLNDKGTNVEILNVREDVMEIFDLLQIPEIFGENVFV